MTKIYELYYYGTTPQGKGDITFYIGKTTQELRDRLAQHMSSARRGEETPKYIKIRHLLKSNITPAIRLLSTSEEEFSEEYEIVKALRTGVKLCNLKKGDRSPHILRVLELANAGVEDFADFVSKYKKLEAKANTVSVEDKLFKTEERLLEANAELLLVMQDVADNKAFVKKLMAIADLIDTL